MRVRGAAQQQHGASLRVLLALEWHHYDVAHLGGQAQRFFQVFWIDVHAFRRDDHVFLSTLEIEISLGVELADVAGAEPVILAGTFRGFESPALPIPRGHVFSADQDLALRVEFHFAPWQHLADGAFPQAEGMIHTY